MYIDVFCCVVVHTIIATLGGTDWRWVMPMKCCHASSVTVRCLHILGVTCECGAVAQWFWDEVMSVIL